MRASSKTKIKRMEKYVTRKTHHLSNWRFPKHELCGNFHRRPGSLMHSLFIHSSPLSGWMVSVLYFLMKSRNKNRRRWFFLVCPQTYISTHKPPCKNAIVPAIFCLRTVIRMIFVIVRLSVCCWCYFPIPYVRNAHKTRRTENIIWDIHQHRRARLAETNAVEKLLFHRVATRDEFFFCFQIRADWLC